MGAGIGALFGLPGMLIGAAVGFASSASKMTLSIQEIIQLREKEISVLSQNINAISKLADLTEGRAKAFGSGNREGVDAADAAINAALSGITDQGVLTDVMAARGSRGALKNYKIDYLKMFRLKE